MSENHPARERVRLGVLWSVTSQAGLKYLRGKCGRADCVIFSNQYKSKDTDPDFILYVSNPRRTDDGNATDQTQTVSTPAPRPVRDDTDDIPF